MRFNRQNGEIVVNPSRDAQRDKNALTLLKLARSTFSGNPRALARIARSLMDAGYSAEAVATAKEAVKIDPNYVVPHFVLGMINMERRKFAEAASSLARAIELGPDMPLPRIVLGDCMMCQDRWEEALTDYNTAAGILPLDARAVVGQAHALMHMGRIDEAMTKAAQAESYAPTNPCVCAKLGLFFLRDVGDVPRAIRLFDMCIALDGRSVIAYEGLFDAHMENGDPEAALACLDALEKVDPEAGMDLALRIAAR